MSFFELYALSPDLFDKVDIESHRTAISKKVLLVYAEREMGNIFNLLHEPQKLVCHKHS